MIREFRLPDLGEGLTESEILSWRVTEGQAVALNQVIADVETAKAVVELPSPFEGTVARLYEAEGTVVEVGSPIISFDVPDAAGALSPVQPAAPAGEQRRQPTLVGYGAEPEKAGRPARRARRGIPVPDAAVPDAAVLAAALPAPQAGVPVSGPASVPVTAPPPATAAPVQERPRSTPPVRKLARDLGVDLATVDGTGPQGRIMRGDVEAALLRSPAGPRGTAGRPEPAQPVVADAPHLGQEREERIPVAGIRKHTAAAMVASAFTAPHATVFLTVDVTSSMNLLDKLRSRKEYDGVRLTPLVLAAKAVCLALRRHPELNARWDEAAREIIRYRYVNLGIAAATPRGLMVPNIKDAQDLGLRELALAISDLAGTAREGRTPPAALTGGTVSISNVGVFGVDAGTPILNPGEAAILALGAVRKQPWEHEGGIALRQVTTLSLSFDHRLVDGAEGAAFLRDIGDVLAEPAMVLALD
ncbi:dihydrolipoamide acetyltransferase family protein [Arthrobacter koreensis]|uniref:dihydrolipoamide acetyltransferase family protein n=1 Tax=Arthrobacter koreensis TaxID=199136 RepID=UPI002DB80BF0|nr:dihydrolipoamide acetyltransferase family protein [Arthrobacter koreensis]MEB7505328.1 2-oxo acid dehydrogenase subunit E2 [Arthrobacter koreensis]